MPDGQIKTAFHVQQRLPGFRVRDFFVKRAGLPVGVEDFLEDGILQLARLNSFNLPFVHGIIWIDAQSYAARRDDATI